MSAPSARLLLDEMFSPRIADHLNAAGHDCIAVAADPALRETSDAALIQLAVADERIFVTNNVIDVEPLRRRRAEAGDVIPPLIYTSDSTFPRNRHFLARLSKALDDACRTGAVTAAGSVLWLRPAPDTT